MEQKDKRRITVFLPQELVFMLKVESYKRGMSMSAFIETLVRAKAQKAK